MKPGIKNRMELQELGDWEDSKPIIADVFNKFVDRMYTALNKDLTFGDNFDATIKELDFKFAELPLSFQSGTKRRPRGLVLLKIEDITTGDHVVLTSLSVPDWTEEDGQVTLNYINGLEDGPLYKARFLIIGED